jgi:hypothetical protein
VQILQRSKGVQIMAGEWIKFECSLPEKPEVMAITTALGWDDPDLTVGKLMRLFKWFDQQTVDGNANGVTPALLDRLIGVTGFVQALVDVGWLVAFDGGLSLHNFEKHNGETAKARAQTAKRVAKHRSNSTPVTSPLAKEEKRREEKKEVSNTESAQAPRFALPEWINAKHWDVWHQCAKRRKVSDAQKQLAVDKLQAWREAGQDHAGALENAAVGGNQGLFLPSGGSGHSRGSAQANTINELTGGLASVKEPRYALSIAR